MRSLSKEKSLKITFKSLKNKIIIENRVQTMTRKLSSKVKIEKLESEGVKKVPLYVPKLDLR